MKTNTQVASLIANWKLSGMSKSNLIRYLAEACLGWPYVWGGYGQFCSPENRRAYADRSACSSAAQNASSATICAPIPARSVRTAPSIALSDDNPRNPRGIFCVI